MAINEKNAGGRQEQTNAQAQQPAGLGGALNEALGGVGTSQRNNTLANLLGAGNRAGVSVLKKSDDLVKLQKRIEEVTAEASEKGDFDFKVIALDTNANAALNISVLVLCQWLKTNVRRVAVRSFALASSIGQLGSRTEQFGNLGQMEVLRVPSSAMDEKMMQHIGQAVKANFPANVQIRDCDYCVVRNGFVFDKPEEGSANIDYAKEMLALSILDLSSELERNTEHYNLVDLTTVRDSSLQIRPKFEAVDTVDATMTPIRSSVKVSLSVVTGNDLVSGTQKEQVVTTALGFIMPAWVGRPQQQSLYAVPGQQQLQPWVPHFVLTGLETGDAQTAETMLLAWAGASVLRVNYAWMQAFRTRDRSKVTLNDIGSLNVFANLQNDPSGFGAIEDTRSADFNQDIYIQTMMRPDLVMSVDVPIGRTLSCFMTLLGDAAAGHGDAITVLNAACDKLTGGKYSTLRAQRGVTGTLVVDSGIILPEGSYLDQDGVWRDLRNFDVVAICNVLAGKENQKMVQFMNCMQSPSVDNAERLAWLRKLYIGLLGEDNVRFDGVYRRLHINANAMAALTDAIGEAIGGQIRSILPTVETANVALTAMGGLDSMILQGNAGNSLFNANSHGISGSGIQSQLGVSSVNSRWGF